LDENVSPKINTKFQTKLVKQKYYSSHTKSNKSIKLKSSAIKNLYKSCKNL